MREGWEESGEVGVGLGGNCRGSCGFGEVLRRYFSEETVFSINGSRKLDSVYG